MELDSKYKKFANFIEQLSAIANNTIEDTHCISEGKLINEHSSKIEGRMKHLLSEIKVHNDMLREIKVNLLKQHKDSTNVLTCKV